MAVKTIGTVGLSCCRAATATELKAKTASGLIASSSLAKRRFRVGIARSPTLLDLQVAADPPTQFVEPLAKYGDPTLRFRVTRNPDQHSDPPYTLLMFRPRRERPRRRTTEQRYELAASHCPMPPVLPTERIAHLGTADCCIHPPGRNETIAVTPSKIFFTEVVPKQGHPTSSPEPPSPPEIVLRQISRDGAWMKI